MNSSTADSAHLIHHQRPAPRFDHAYPLGNGRLGAMFYGIIGKERITLNEDTIWSRTPGNANSPSAKEHLPEMRRLLMEGKPRQAMVLAEAKMMGTPNDVQPYEVLGELTLNCAGDLHAVPERYERSLDLNAAIARCEYSLHGITFTREVFVSGADQVVVVRWTASQPGAIDAVLRFERDSGAAVTADDEGLFGITGQAGKHGTQFRSLARAIPEGGKMSASPERLHVAGADALTVICADATDAQLCARPSRISPGRYRS